MKLVIVRDMWLTGFDAPCLHTMYVDKPMQGHGLMQAIARVNRVFKDKPGGLVVDYLGLADQLKKALADYTEQDRDQTGIPIEQALDVLQEKYEVVREMFHGFDYSKFFSGTPGERVRRAGRARWILFWTRASRPNRRRRRRRRQSEAARKEGAILQAVTELSLAYALVSTQDEAVAIREEVAFFQCIRAMLVKMTPKVGKTADQLDHAVRQIISRAVASDEVIDIFAVAGLGQTEYLDPLRRIPGRSARNAAEEFGVGSAAKASERRNQVAVEEKPDSIAIVFGNAGSHDPPLSKSLDRYGPGDCRTGEVGQGNARSSSGAARIWGLPTMKWRSTTRWKLTIAP